MRRFELDDLINRPGTYFNPQTEVLLIVDDSPDLDNEIFNMEEFEGADWVLVSDESPVEEHVRDEILERFQTRHSATDEGFMEDADDGSGDEDFDGYDVSHPDDE